MAKLKTDNTETKTEDNSNPIVTEGATEGANSSTTVEETVTAEGTTETKTEISETPKPKETPNASKTSSDKPKSEPKIEPHINSVLKAFPSHKELYVDAHGGAFTTDTAPVIRKGAKLYQNPHYQS